MLRKIGFLSDFSKNDNNEKAISSFFSPEFRNRLDAVINFDMLSKDSSPVDKFLMELELILLEKDLSLTVTQNAKKKVEELGFDINNGARPRT